jgi:hypothetical protein
VQQRRGQQQVAGRIPRAGQRFGKLRIAHQQRAVQIDRTRHTEVVEREGNGCVRESLMPAQPVPDDAIEARPAQSPFVGKGNVDPARGRWAFRLDGARRLGIEGLSADGLNTGKRDRDRWRGMRNGA